MLLNVPSWKVGGGSYLRSVVNLGLSRTPFSPEYTADNSLLFRAGSWPPSDFVPGRTFSSFFRVYMLVFTVSSPSNFLLESIFNKCAIWPSRVKNLVLDGGPVLCTSSIFARKYCTPEKLCHAPKIIGLRAVYIQERLV
jgi:hypothetical protein